MDVEVERHGLGLDGAAKSWHRACGTPMAFASTTWRRRTAPLLLLAAAAGAYFMIGPRLPHDQDVALDLGDRAMDVTGLEIAWSRSTEEQPQLSTRWHFALGKAPRRLPTRVRLPGGPWLADVEIERAGVVGVTRWSRRVNLTGDAMTLPLHEALR